MDPKVAKELSDQLAGGLKAYVAALLTKRADPLEQRIAAVEMRCGALSMINTRGISPERVTALEQMLARVDALETRIKQLEAK